MEICQLINAEAKHGKETTESEGDGLFASFPSRTLCLLVIALWLIAAVQQDPDEDGHDVEDEAPHSAIVCLLT